MFHVQWIGVVVQHAQEQKSKQCGLQWRQEGFIDCNPCTLVLFTEWIHIASPQLEGLVCTELSLIKKVFDSYSASVWKLSCCLWKGGCLYFAVYDMCMCVCVCKGGEITVRKMRSLL